MENDTSYKSLSQLNSAHSAETLKTAVLIGEGFDYKEVTAVIDAVKKSGAVPEVVSDKLGSIAGDGGSLEADKAFLNVHPALYDAVYVAGGKSENQPDFDSQVHDFTRNHYTHLKPIGVAKGAESYILHTDGSNPAGVVFAKDEKDFAGQFTSALAQIRFWNRK